MPVKLKDIAEKTGFSITTVSRALAGYDDVNEQTRNQIIQAAHALGYQPNLVARQLRSQSTQTIGLIIPSNDHSFSSGFFSQLMVGIGDGASEVHYDLLVSAQTPGEEEMGAYRRFVGGNRVDGMVLARTRRNDPRIHYLKQQHKPFVVSGRGSPDEASDFPYIDVDSRAGIRSATEHLIVQGHQRIGLILPPLDMAFTPYRYEGYGEALQRAGLPYRAEYVLHGDLTNTGGYDAAMKLLQHGLGITAIVVCNDLMALGAMSAVQNLGLRVGQDIAVTGFDDIPAAAYAYPPLTTLRQPIYEIGRMLAKMLVAVIEGNPPEQTQIVMPVQLIVRDSSGAVRANGTRQMREVE